MEYAPSGEVIDLIIAHGKLNEKHASQLFRQVVYAIDYCHSLHVIRMSFVSATRRELEWLGPLTMSDRDLKPENLLLDSNHHIKIIDFGLSNVYNPGMCSLYHANLCGCLPNYSILTGRWVFEDFLWFSDLFCARTRRAASIQRTASHSLFLQSPKSTLMSQGVAIDIWSLGVVLFVFVCGFLPFDGT